jgi:Cft2 family RNA processing exonuclease
MTREHIIYSASRQYLEGDVQHWWHPYVNSGIRTRFSDDLLWMPYVVEDYIKKLGYDKIDLLIITHLHDDHVSGLVNIIESLQVKKIWINVKPLKSTSDIVKRFSPVVAGNESGMLFINALSSYAKILDQCCKKNIPIEQNC